MGKTRLKTKASSEAARWSNVETTGMIRRGPSSNGNDFDVRMCEEDDGCLGAQKCVQALVDNGVCLVEANAPPELLKVAFEEAQDLWKGGAFGPPLRIYDQNSMAEAQMWENTLRDELKVVWIKKGSKVDPNQQALTVLAKNIQDFGVGLSGSLKSMTGIEVDRQGQAMLSCYTSDRTYNLHLDNPFALGQCPDIGVRLTLTYYLNPHWDPNSDSVAGGLDFFLTDPTGAPSSASEARGAPRLRVAPHADTLVAFLSERMAHQVIETQGPTQWFCLTVFFMCAEVMQEAQRVYQKMRQQPESDDED